MAEEGQLEWWVGETHSTPPVSRQLPPSLAVPFTASILGELSVP